MSRVILYFLRQPFSLFTACSTRHCGTSACCSLLCLRVGFSFLCGSAGGWAESLSCYFLTSFATSFGRRSARRGFKNGKPIGPIGEVGCCESRMAERSHSWTERWLMFPLFLIHPRFHGVLRFGHDLGMSFLKQRFHGDLLASFDPGMS